jgi:hypothetical protein
MKTTGATMKVESKSQLKDAIQRLHVRLGNLARELRFTEELLSLRQEEINLMIERETEARDRLN